MKSKQNTDTPPSILPLAPCSPSSTPIMDAAQGWNDRRDLLSQIGILERELDQYRRANASLDKASAEMLAACSASSSDNWKRLYETERRDYAALLKSLNKVIKERDFAIKRLECMMAHKWIESERVPDVTHCSSSLNPETDELRDLYENYEHRCNMEDLWDLCASMERERNVLAGYMSKPTDISYNEKADDRLALTACSRSLTPETDANEYGGSTFINAPDTVRLVHADLARKLEIERNSAIAALMTIEERYIDGCDTYEDWEFMGESARAFLSENA